MKFTIHNLKFNPSTTFRVDGGHSRTIKILVMLISFLYLLIVSPSAFAHKVNIFAYVEGDTVYTESFFPDGKKVKGGIIEVYDSQDKKLLEGVTDEEGQFNFKPAKKDDLRIVINASLGHRNSYMLSRDELLGLGIRERREEVSPREVISGIGYIFGITGIIFYFLSKRRNG